MSVDCPPAKRDNASTRSTLSRPVIFTVSSSRRSSMNSPARLRKLCALSIIPESRTLFFFGNFIVCLLSFLSSKFLPIHAVYSVMARQMFLLMAAESECKTQVVRRTKMIEKPVVRAIPNRFMNARTFAVVPLLRVAFAIRSATVIFFRVDKYLCGHIQRIITENCHRCAGTQR